MAWGSNKGRPGWHWRENKSAKTSINKTKVPYLFTHVPEPWKHNDINLDIGGGRYDTATEYLHNTYMAHNVIYDPYNRSQEENDKALEIVAYDTATISNVLNVIPDRPTRIRVLTLAREKATRAVFITVYEGDRSGIPSATQLNRRLKEYLPEVQEVFCGHPITVKNRIISIDMLHNTSRKEE